MNDVQRRAQESELLLAAVQPYLEALETRAFEALLVAPNEGVIASRDYIKAIRAFRASLQLEITQGKAVKPPGVRA